MIEVLLFVMQMRKLSEIHRRPKMVENGKGKLDEQSLVKDQAKVQDDEKLDEEHESALEALAEFGRTLSLSLSNRINTSTSSMISQSQPLDYSPMS